MVISVLSPSNCIMASLQMEVSRALGDVVTSKMPFCNGVLTYSRFGSGSIASQYHQIPVLGVDMTILVEVVLQALSTDIYFCTFFVSALLASGCRYSNKSCK